MLFHSSHVISTDDYPVLIMPSHETVQWELERTIRSARWGREPLVVVALVNQSCPTLCDPMDCSPPGSSVHGNSLGKSTGVGCHSILQGIFPTQGLNLGLLHCRQILYHLSHQGSQNNLLSSSKNLVLCEAEHFLL